LNLLGEQLGDLEELLRGKTGGWETAQRPQP
jgi:hypothetical protein